MKYINSTEIYVSFSISNEYIMRSMVRDFYVHTSINFVFLFLSFSLLFTHFWLQLCVYAICDESSHYIYRNKQKKNEHKKQMKKIYEGQRKNIQWLVFGTHTTL